MNNYIILGLVAYFLLKKKVAPVTTVSVSLTPSVPPVLVTPVPPVPTPAQSIIYPTPQAALVDIPPYIPPPSVAPSVSVVTANPIVLPIPVTDPSSPTPVPTPIPVMTTTVVDPGPPYAYYGIYFTQPDGVAKSPGFLWDSYSRRWTSNGNATPALAGISTGGAAVLVPSVPDVQAPSPNPSPLVMAYTRYPYYSASTDGIHITILPNVNQ